MSELPEGWEAVSFKDLGEWFGGGTPSKANPAFWEGGSLPWLSPKDMGPDVLTGTQDAINAVAVKETSAKLVPSGSVAVVVRSGILERTLPVALVPFETTLNQDMKAVVPRPGILPEWIAWGLRAGGTELLARVRKSGTTVASVEMSKFFAQELPVPPLDEQRRIVAILEDHLSRLDAALGMTKSAAERFRVFERSLLQNAILGRTGPAAGKPVDPSTGLPRDWKWEPWPKVGESQNGKAFSSRLYQPHGVRLIRPGNLSPDGSMSWTDTNTRCLPPEVAEENPSYMVRESEIVMNLTAQSLKDDFLGRVCMTGAGETALLNQRLARLTPLRVESRFAYYVFRSPIFRYFVSSLNTGSLIQHMFTKQLADFRLPMPPMEEQVAIANFLDAEQVGFRHAEGLLLPLEGRATGLRQSLLAAAFSGQLAKEIVNV